MTPIPIEQRVKLAAPISDFRFFAEDQVLTAAQLNRLIQYLDFQERSTRAWLVGAGIVCGLGLTVLADRVVLGAGCALTSDGDLLTVDTDRPLTHVRPFVDDKANYPPLAAGEEPYFELISAEEAASDSEAQALASSQLSQKAVLLYLESYIEPPDVCTATDCDNQGPAQRNTLRVLVVPESRVAAQPRTPGDVAAQLPEVLATRPKLQEGTIKKLEGDDGLQQRYTVAIETTRTDLVTALSMVRQFWQDLSPILEAKGPDELPDFTKLLPSTPDPRTEVPGLQYLHALFGDVARTYREWRESLFCLKFGCGIAPNAHPKHVVLGRAATTAVCPPDPLRQRLIRSAAYHDCSDGVWRARLLWQRLVGLPKHFSAAAATAGIRITPSRSCDALLGERARPAYYGDQFSAPWNVEARLRCLTDAPKSYFSSSDAAFRHDICGASFLRIEGHVGKPLGEAQAALERLRKMHNLPFQILAIQLEDDPDRAVAKPVRFFDIETLFYNYRTDFKFRLNDISGYTDQVRNAIEGSRERIPSSSETEGVEAPDVGVALQASGELKANAAEATRNLPRAFREFTEQTVTGFVGAYANAISKGHQLIRNTASLAQRVQTTPSDRIVQPEIATNYGILLDILRKRRRKVAELSTFAKFVANNPGLEHLGGVAPGGTFVLVYSASTDPAQRIVKADFCLPYYSYFDMASLEEEDPPAEPDTPTAPPFFFKPRPWIEHYKWEVSDITPKVLNARVDRLVKDTLPAQIKTNVAEQFQTLTSLASMFGKGGTAVLPGAGGIDLASSPLYGALFAEMNGLSEQLAKFQVAGNEELAKQVEEQLAEKVVKATQLVGANATAAASQGRPVAEVDEAMASFITGKAISMESESAKKAVRPVIRQVSKQIPVSISKKLNPGNIFGKG